MVGGIERAAVARLVMAAGARGGQTARTAALVRQPAKTTRLEPIQAETANELETVVIQLRSLILAILKLVGRVGATMTDPSHEQPSAERYACY